MEKPNTPPIEKFPGAVESNEGFNDLCVFTTTFYGAGPVSLVRQELAIKLLENCATLGIHTVVVDGGSNEAFLERARQIGGVEIVVDASLKMGESRRKALEIAMEHQSSPYFLWVEPEKDNLITSESLNTMIDGLRKGDVDIVVPRRMNKGSMPKFQAWIEDLANKRATAKMEGVEEPLDLWFGPKMFNRDGAKYFAEYKGKLDKWDSIIKPVLDAHEGGSKVGSADVDYTYDPSQAKSEEHDDVMKRKRVIQYVDILNELGDSVAKDAFKKAGEDRK